MRFIPNVMKTRQLNHIYSWGPTHVHDAITSLNMENGLNIFTGWTTAVWFPVAVQIFISTIASMPFLCAPQPPIHCLPGALSPGMKRPGRETNHSPPYSTEVKNTWSYNFSPPYVYIAWCLVEYERQLYFYFVSMSPLMSALNGLCSWYRIVLQHSDLPHTCITLLRFCDTKYSDTNLTSVVLGKYLQAVGVIMNGSNYCVRVESIHSRSVVTQTRTGYVRYPSTSSWWNNDAFPWANTYINIHIAIYFFLIPLSLHFTVFNSHIRYRFSIVVTTIYKGLEVYTLVHIHFRVITGISVSKL
jgi:hypothetical protein